MCKRNKIHYTNELWELYQKKKKRAEYLENSLQMALQFHVDHKYWEFIEVSFEHLALSMLRGIWTSIDQAFLSGNSVRVG